MPMRRVSIPLFPLRRLRMYSVQGDELVELARGNVVGRTETVDEEDGAEQHECDDSRSFPRLDAVRRIVL